MKRFLLVQIPTSNVIEDVLRSSANWERGATLGNYEVIATGNENLLQKLISLNAIVLPAFWCNSNKLPPAVQAAIKSDFANVQFTNIAEILSAIYGHDRWID